jgi:hypothetical protein
MGEDNHKLRDIFYISCQAVDSWLEYKQKYYAFSVTIDLI